VVYDATHVLEAGGTRLELSHARGETDDHTWLWWPARRTLFTGDLFFWVAPNAGNPQKVQRYAAEWARALRTMAGRGAELLIPGHGVPILGAARVRQTLEDTAEWLETLERETVTRMNAGLALDQILAEVRPPAHLADRPYLQAVYDEPEYVVRNIWRLYGGWWDGQPAHLKPAREAEIGLEVAALAGGAEALSARARPCRARPPRSRLSSRRLGGRCGARQCPGPRGARGDLRGARRDFRRAHDAWYLRFHGPRIRSQGHPQPSRRARFSPGSRRTTAMTGPRRLPITTAMALCVLGAVGAVIPLHAQPLATPDQRELAQARENAKWEQAIAAKRLDAFLRDEPGPVRCQAFVEWSPRLYAVAASPNAEQHGVRRGTVSRSSARRA
jgi:hypothetical protein